MYGVSDYESNIIVVLLFSCVSKSYSESNTLKLANMVLSIFDEYNLTDSYINDDVRIEYNDLLKLEDLARDIIIGDYGDNKE